MANKKSDNGDNAIPVSVALRPSQLQKIERLVHGSRSDFIRNAVDHALSRADDDYDERIDNSIKNFLNHHWFENALVPMTWESDENESRAGRFNPALMWNKTEERMMAHVPRGVPIESVFPEDILDWLNLYMRNLESQWEVLDESGRVAFAKAALSGYKVLKEKYGAM